MQVLIALDQLLNALLGGWADETLSAKAYRKRHDNRTWMWAHDLIDIVFFFQPHHCKTSYESEKQRKQLPAEYRT